MPQKVANIDQTEKHTKWSSSSNPVQQKYRGVVVNSPHLLQPNLRAAKTSANLLQYTLPSATTFPKT